MEGALHDGSNRARRSAAALTLTLVVACNGIDLAAVRNFATRATSAQRSFDGLAADNAATCIRRTENARQTQTQLRAVPDDLEAALSNPSDDCYEAAILAMQWRLRNRIVVAYVRAISGIARVNAVPSNATALGDGLAAISILPQDDVSAFAHLTSTIASAAIESRQRAEIGSFAKANDAALKTALASLQFVADRYDEQLVNERSTLDQVFRDTLRARTHAATQTLPQPVAFERQRLAIRAIRFDWDRERATIAERRAAASAYKDALGIIGSANASIVARAGRFSASDLAELLTGYVDSFGDDLATLEKSEE